MTKAEALYNFFSSFGITAYVNTSVPDNATFPYFTYEFITGEFGDDEIPINVRLYYRTESEAIPNAKVEELANRIGRGGTTIQYDGGAIWIKKGSPFCQTTMADDDNTIKMKYINVDIEYL